MKKVLLIISMLVIILAIHAQEVKVYDSINCANVTVRAGYDTGVAINVVDHKLFGPLSVEMDWSNLNTNTAVLTPGASAKNGLGGSIYVDNTNSVVPINCDSIIVNGTTYKTPVITIEAVEPNAYLNLYFDMGGSGVTGWLRYSVSTYIKTRKYDR